MKGVEQSKGEEIRVTELKRFHLICGLKYLTNFKKSFTDFFFVVDEYIDVKNVNSLHTFPQLNLYLNNI